MPILGKASPEDMNLHPMRYQWAYDLYNQAVRNTWFPHEIALKEDLEDWNKMTEDERHAVKFTMAFFNPAELIVNRSIALGVYPYLKSPECHLYLAKPPLFELVKQGRKSSIYIYDEDDLEAVINKAIEERKKNGTSINKEEERFRQAGFIEQKRYIYTFYRN